MLRTAGSDCQHDQHTCTEVQHSYMLTGAAASSGPGPSCISCVTCLAGRSIACSCQHPHKDLGPRLDLQCGLGGLLRVLTHELLCSPIMGGGLSALCALSGGRCCACQRAPPVQPRQQLLGLIPQPRPAVAVVLQRCATISRSYRSTAQMIEPPVCDWHWEQSCAAELEVEPAKPQLAPCAT